MAKVILNQSKEGRFQEKTKSENLIPAELFTATTPKRKIDLCKCVKPNHDKWLRQPWNQSKQITPSGMNQQEGQQHVQSVVKSIYTDLSKPTHAKSEPLHRW
jgi:hypothetical protein